VSGAERDYHYVLTLADAGGPDRHDVARRIEDAVAPVWAALVAEGAVRQARALWRVGDVDLATDAPAPGTTSWNLTLLTEVSPGVDPAEVAAHERSRLEAAGALAPPLTVRARELLVRRRGSGVAVPRPREDGPLPPGFTVGIEHIWVPSERWLEYREAMRTIFGPVGIKLVEWGDAHRVTVTEVAERLERDPGLPEWNRIHVLEGRFVDGADGFAAASSRAVVEVLGAGTDIGAELGRVAAYRRKPAMTENVELAVVG
jgi:hypothetical protein